MYIENEMFLRYAIGSDRLYLIGQKSWECWQKQCTNLLFQSQPWKFPALPIEDIIPLEGSLQ